MSYESYDYNSPEHSQCYNRATTPRNYYFYSINDFAGINEGTHCVIPTFGKGWHEETIDGELVQVGVECEGDETWNYDTYSIAKLGSTCRMVCRGSNGGNFLPETNTEREFKCTTPIPVQMFSPAKGYNQWLDQGLRMFGPLLSPGFTNHYKHYYYNWQTSTFSLEWRAELFNKCYKINSMPSCDTLPGLTPFEQEQGQTGEGSLYTCTDSNQPGSICTKSCDRGYADQPGNAEFVCICRGETCSWDPKEVPTPYPHSSPFPSEPLSCIQGCHANPASIWDYLDRNDNVYKVQCSDYEDDLKWNPLEPAPVKLGSTCTVKCQTPYEVYGDNYIMEGFMDTGLSDYQIKCVLPQE